MAGRSVWMGAAALVLGMPIAGCQQFLPRDDTPVLPPQLANLPDPGPSAQRQDAEGYPMLGAYPATARPQVSDEEVAATQARFRNAGRRANGAGTGAYQRNVAELQAIAAQQQARAAAAAAPVPAADDADASSRAQ